MLTYINKLQWKSIRVTNHSVYSITNNATRCNCSSYARIGICRHLVHYRKIGFMPVFNINIMNPHLVKRNYRQESENVNLQSRIPPANPGIDEENLYREARKTTDLTAELMSNLDPSRCNLLIQQQMQRRPDEKSWYFDKQLIRVAVLNFKNASFLWVFNQFRLF